MLYYDFVYVSNWSHETLIDISNNLIIKLRQKPIYVSNKISKILDHLKQMIFIYMELFNNSDFNL